ncbi:heavy-metal-associated domain-containing protein [Haloechinothrix sp. LS1_15]|uniref:heavy-metal-associated domain-containing protein n=1 Tax=Haloechinothrix sp. LS1_15 TaxID=2652248 RepID=UPI002945DFFC|nr:heavy-metal-associated domain-containing protein [Haloechinothrix sp. LS1_15]MDV6011273.1 heavy-metal-associated domain-containing protein [Haloechinothrix sp. LS1_15]
MTENSTGAGHTTTYTVSGMSCGHCAQAVRDEVGALTGVTEIAVDVESGAVTVSSEQPLPEESVRVAVADAGYELTGTAAA